MTILNTVQVQTLRIRVTEPRRILLTARRQAIFSSFKILLIPSRHSLFKPHLLAFQLANFIRGHQLRELMRELWLLVKLIGQDMCQLLHNGLWLA